MYWVAMSDFAGETVVGSVGAVLGVAFDAARTLSRTRTRSAASTRARAHSPLAGLHEPPAVAAADAGRRGLLQHRVGKQRWHCREDGNELDVIGTYCMAGGCLTCWHCSATACQVTRLMAAVGQAPSPEPGGSDQGATDNPLGDDGAKRGCRNHVGQATSHIQTRESCSPLPPIGFCRFTGPWRA